MFRTDIQGLRAVAVGAVVAYHVGLPFAAGGYVGVDVFFVISGFLISGHLIREYETTGRIRFPAFYARRARRILPAAITVAVATVVAVSILLPSLRVVEVMKDALATILFVPNIWFAWQSTDYLSPTAASPFQHYWSLGVEEQFYLIWPAFLLIVLHLRRWLPVSLGIVALLSFILGGWLISVDIPWTFFSLPTRAWEFAVGALVAIALDRAGDRVVAWPGWLRAAIGWMGLAAIVAATGLFTASTPFPGFWAAIPVVGTALVILVGGAPSRGGPHMALGLRPLQFIGLISFSVYLVHWPALNLTETVLGERMTTWIALGIGVLTIPAAWLLYRFVERPFLIRGRMRRAAPALAGAAIATLAGLAVVAGAVTIANARPDDSGVAVDPVAGTPTTYVPTNLRPSLDDASGDLPSIYNDDCHVRIDGTTWIDCRFGAADASTTVALFGDSHAANWFPALEAAADADGFQLRTFTKSACSAPEIVPFREGTLYTACLDWRASVIDELTTNPPDLIILAGSAAETTVEEWEAGTREVVSLLSKTSPVVFLADVPDFSQPMPECLEAHLADALACARPVDDVVPIEVNERAEAATFAGGGVFVDLTGVICPEGLCSGILGDILLYRDNAHLTATFSATLAPRFEQLVDENIARGR